MINLTNSMMLRFSLRTLAAVGFLAVAYSTIAISARADNLVTNGGFESTTPIGAGNPSTANGGQLSYNINATGWTNNGYTFLYTSGSAATGGVSSQYGVDDLMLYGPGNGYNNGLTGSPAGGNFIASDGAYLSGPITQTLSGLSTGQTYTIGFWWAGAQQYGYSGTNQEGWQVSLGDQTFNTSVYTNSTAGFSGWMYQTFTFQWDGNGDLLSFLAYGSPSGVPPFALLDGVSVGASEPGPATLTLTGLGLMGGLILLASKKLAFKSR